MLFLPPEASGPIRAQGVMISDPEVERVITYWQKSIESLGTEDLPPWDTMLEEEQALAAKDKLLTEAVEIVRDSQRASASMLQRRLRIGYPRAARLVDEMETMGVIGPAQRGGKEREVFIGRDDETPERSDD
jgi:S-DNA-T family DNA segregation ATPase FtsK/SpoIIIE